MDNQKPTAPNGAKKNNTLMIVLIILGILIVLGIGGCVAAGFIAKKVGQSFVSGVTGGTVKVNNDGSSIKLSDGDTSISTGDSAKWPTDLPADLPQPTFGKITGSSKITSEKSWNIIMENVTADQAKSYMELLKTKGWVQKSQTDFMISINQFKKDNWDLTVTHDPSSNGLSINLLPQL